MKVKIKKVKGQLTFDIPEYLFQKYDLKEGDTIKITEIGHNFLIIDMPEKNKPGYVSEKVEDLSALEIKDGKGVLWV